MGQCERFRTHIQAVGTLATPKVSKWYGICSVKVSKILSLLDRLQGRTHSDSERLKFQSLGLGIFFPGIAVHVNAGAS